MKEKTSLFCTKAFESGESNIDHHFFILDSTVSRKMDNFHVSLNFSFACAFVYKSREVTNRGSLGIALLPVSLQIRLQPHKVRLVGLGFNMINPLVLWITPFGCTGTHALGSGVPAHQNTMD